MIRRFEQAIEDGRDFFKTTQRKISEDVIQERILKSLEPWIAKWIQRSGKDNSVFSWTV